MPKKMTIDDMQKLASERGGECLSEEYTNMKTELHWQCAEGHDWKALPTNVKHHGSWCPECAGVTSNSIDDAKKVARQRGGKCLSEIYENNRQQLEWQCKEGHTWRTTLHSVKDLGTWCSECAGNAQLSIEDMQKLAEERGGKCLSKEYINSSTRLEWECSYGHSWEASPDNIKRGRWCPECYTSLGERLVRCAFEQMFGCEFPTSYPEWLVSKTGSQLELDGYNKSLGLAFEHQGGQHYEKHPLFHTQESDLRELQLRDQHKKELCQEHGVVLVCIEEVPSKISVSNLKNEILNKLETDHRFEEHGVNRTEPLDFTDAYLTSHAKKRLTMVKKKAREKGGKCLSDRYVNSHTKLEFECSEGHRWEATPANLLNGDKWCRKCSGYAKLSIEDMQKEATKRGGKCLSDEYVNSQTKLEWECSEGHRWEAIPNSVRRGHWCPKCVRNN